MKNKYFFLVFVFFISCNLFANTTDSIPNEPSSVRVLNNNFKEKHQVDDAYNYLEKEPSLYTKAKLWFLSKIRELFNATPDTAVTVFNTLKIIFYILIIAGVIYYLVRVILNKNSRWLFTKKDEGEGFTHNNIEENITNTNFKNLIKDAIKNEDYRLAVRFYYLLLLKKLDKASIIQYAPQKTNVDYQQELISTKLSNDFVKASYYYSYIWYGEFAINKNDYQTTSLVYDHLLKQIDNA